jgi:hypothetical protein
VSSPTPSQVIGLQLWSYRAGLLLQRWQHVLIQAASPLWASHPFPHFHTFLPVLQAPSSLRPNFGRFVGPRDGATATYQGGSNSDIILDSAKWNSGTPDSRTSFRGVENRGRICPAPGVEPVTIRMGSGRHRFYATVVWRASKCLLRTMGQVVRIFSNVYLKCIRCESSQAKKRPPTYIRRARDKKI